MCGVSQARSERERRKERRGKVEMKSRVVEVGKGEDIPGLARKDEHDGGEGRIG